MQNTRQALVLMFSLAASLALAQPGHAQADRSAPQALTGSEVLDLDGSIVRRDLQAAAGRDAPQHQAPESDQVYTPKIAKHKAGPPRTIDVFGLNATAIGGPVLMKAIIQWNDRSYPIHVGSLIKGYRVTRIDQNGTDLVGIHGAGRLHIPRPTLDEEGRDDVIDTSAAAWKEQQPSFTAPKGEPSQSAAAHSTSSVPTVRAPVTIPLSQISPQSVAGGAARADVGGQ